MTKSNSSILDKFESLKGKILNEKSQLKDAYNIQPNREDQTGLIIHNAAKKFVRFSINEGILPIIEKDGNTRRQNRYAVVDMSDESNRPVTAPGTLETTLSEFLSDMESSKQRPVTAGGGESRRQFYDTIRKGGSRVADLRQRSNFKSELQQQLFDDTKDSQRLFNALVNSITGSKRNYIQPGQVCRWMVDIETPEIAKRNSRRHHHNHAQSQQREGMAFIIDPSTNTHGTTLVLEITYIIEIAPTFDGRMSIFSKDKPEMQVIRKQRIVSHEICGDGIPHGLYLSQSSTSSSSNKNNTYTSNTGVTVTSVASDGFFHTSSATAEAAAGHSSVKLPGWQGRSLIFIPATACTCQLYTRKSFLESPTSSPSSPVSRKHIVAPKVFPNSSDKDLRISICTFHCHSSKHASSKIESFFQHEWKARIANIVVPGGMPALNLAALHGNYEAVTNLIMNGASINKVSRGQKTTALHEAVIGGHANIVKYLIENGASQMCKDYAGNTPLHIASLHGKASIARLLTKDDIAKHALSSRNVKHQKPLDCASSKFMTLMLKESMKEHKLVVEERKKLVA